LPRTSRDRVVQLCADDRHETEARARATEVGLLELVRCDSLDRVEVASQRCCGTPCYNPLFRATISNAVALG
jgi:hypothetical protein